MKSVKELKKNLHRYCFLYFGIPVISTRRSIYLTRVFSQFYYIFTIQWNELQQVVHFLHTYHDFD